MIYLVSLGVSTQKQGLVRDYRKFPTLKVATLPGQAMEKYKQELKTGKFMLEDCEEVFEFGDKEDIELAYEKICRILKQLDKSKDDVTENMLGREDTIDIVRQWNQVQKEEIRPIREMRKRLKEKLDWYSDQDSRQKQEREIELQRQIMEEQTRITLRKEKEMEDIKIRQQEREEEWCRKKLELETEAAAKRCQEEKGKVQSVKLQKYTITPFKGEYKDWLRFWNQFMVEVDGSGISEISKFNYLLELVTGKPREDILGLPHTRDGYEEAKRILEQTYGRDIKIHKTLIKELENLPHITSVQKLTEIHNFYNHLARIIRTLVTMKKLETAQSFVYSLMDKLGPVKEALVRKDDEWEEWKLEELVENLRKYIDRNPLPETDTGASPYPSLVKKRNEFQDWRNKRDKMLLASVEKPQRRTPGCVYCGLPNHRSVDCLKVLDVAARKDILKKSRLCFNCTGFGHMATKCNSRGCGKCNRKHHTSICDVTTVTSSPAPSAPSPDIEQGKRAVNKNTAIHATVVAKVNGITARIMIDSGSGSSYVCTSLLTQLKLKPSKIEKRIIEQMYGTVTRRVEIYKVKITSDMVDDFEMELTCINGEKEILTFLPNPRIKSLKKKYNRFRCLSFSDEDAMDDMLPVHLILGTSDFQRIRTTEPLVLGPNPDRDPGAEFTMLGWTLSGKTVGSEVGAEKGFFMNSTKDEFEQMCSLEVLGLSDELGNEEDFHENFKKNIKRMDDGSYQTRLPWKPDHCAVPTNQDLAMARLHSTTRKLEKLGKLEDYHQVMLEQVQDGILEKIPDKPTGGIVHYVPHQPVIREEAESTRLRIVYDCSARASSQVPSLNDCLETGPSLQPHIFDILLRNRMKKYCITGDVKKAFLQIKLDPMDRDAQRLFWYDNLEERTITAYRFTRVIFGSAPSPYILGATLEKHINQYEEKYPQTVKNLKENTYVDDVQSVCNTVEELLNFKEEATNIMKEGGFKLHKWHSNAPVEVDATRSETEVEDPTYAKVIVGTQSSETKILGIPWNTEKDKFRISFAKCIENGNGGAVTKRKMLSIINGVFDLLGFVSPVIITGKILYSKVCLKKISWDEELTSEIAEPWHKWIKCLARTPSVSIPRSVISGEVVKMVLHGFADASKLAVSAAIYIVAYYSNSDVSQRLLVSKSRIAPKKSIPRLELVGAHTLCKLVNHVKKTLVEYPIEEFHGWLDSTTVLHWLEGNGTWTQFVRNRATAIRESNLTKWHYVPTEENPSDKGTRGVAPEKLGRLWFHGPDWLHNKDEWPSQPDIVETPDTLCESLPRKERQLFAKEQIRKPDHLGTLLEKCSYWKTLRITAFVMRFIAKCRGRRIQEPMLTAEEINSADTYWMKRSQASEELKSDIALEIDESGVWRCNGRIPGYNPIFLPKNNRLVASLIQQSHEKTLHGGVSMTLSDMRKRYWVPKLRSQVKKIVHQCNRCKRHRVKPLPSPGKSMLPKFRAQLSQPFAFTGVDFAGPIIYKIKKSTFGKSYVALFTCASTRAVHLKLCKDMSALEFKRTMKEFVARRGLPQVMVSDNGRTFVATNKWMKTLVKNEDLMNFLAVRRIKWKFNLSRAAWWGGFFERLVGIMKRSLSKTIGRKLLTFPELEEVLLDVECTMNNRPLCYQGEEFEHQVITPNILLRGKPEVLLEEDLDKLAQGTQLTKRIIFTRKSKEQLRKRWISEYLYALEERKRQFGGGADIIPKTGAIVLLKEDTKNKSLWKLGRVIASIHGRDAVVRGLKLKLGNGNIVERPLQLVCDMEIGGEDDAAELNPKAKEFIPEGRPTRKTKTEALNQIKGVGMYEDEED